MKLYGHQEKTNSGIDRVAFYVEPMKFCDVFGTIEVSKPGQETPQMTEAAMMVARAFHESKTFPSITETCELVKMAIQGYVPVPMKTVVKDAEVVESQSCLIGDSFRTYKFPHNSFNRKCTYEVQE